MSEIPWTLFLSSDRRMARLKSRDFYGTRATATSDGAINDETWSTYLSSKCSNFAEICRQYPITTFIGSNRQMVRRVTAQASAHPKK